ncbi:MAG: hypothetical protein JJU46_10135 [Balneolaceae bacterium]|nr:hypothetical protein [Balneolaceae bacterium]MCH8547858.1 hypothetical protein [Balneolaceae bacterium]
MQPQDRLVRNVWLLSLLSFLIAALAGFLYRYGMLWQLSEWIGFANLRHAHSHLMFFNWVAPPLLVWMMVEVMPDGGERYIGKFAAALYTMIFLGFLSFPLFLLYGYHSVSIGSASLPLAAIVSGLVMITWYWFSILWYRLRAGAKDSLALSFYDAALIALLISSLGAWGVSVFQFTDIDAPLISSAMTHFFLGVFTEGWVVLGLLGMIWKRVGEPDTAMKREWLWLPLLAGSLLVFPFSLNQSVITPAMHMTANLGLLLIGISLVLNLWLLFKQPRFNGLIWRTVAALITLKVLVQIIAILPFNIWPGEHGLRVLYLHILLLGITSIALFELYHAGRDWIAKLIFAVAVLALLLTLVMISGYWPAALASPQLYRWVAVAALLPVLPALWLFISALRSETTIFP